MSCAGIFLITFLPVHIGTNLTFVFSDSTETFSMLATFMPTKPVIMVLEVVLFGGLLLHVVPAILLYKHNRQARPTPYFKDAHSRTSYFSRYTIHTATVIGIFLLLHLYDF